MSDLDSDDLANKALFLEAQLTRSGRFCPYTTATSTATLSSAYQISENSDQQQPQQRSASHGGGCGCRSPYTGNLVEVAVGNRVCDWRSLSWMGPFRVSSASILSQRAESSYFSESYVLLPTAINFSFVRFFQGSSDCPPSTTILSMCVFTADRKRLSLARARAYLDISCNCLLCVQKYLEDAP